ncbi:MAG: exosome nuclease subunit [Pleopsidium flavum]|nr:MAG: exosome nuclease subunit [Pleopsidium flavum]
MDSSSSFKSFQDRISSSLVDVARTTGQTAAEDLGFQRSLNSSVASGLDSQNLRLLDIAGRLVKAAALGSEVEAPQLHHAEALEENWRGVVDVIDSLLEKADACLDEYTGVVKRLSPSQQEQVPASSTKATGATKAFRIQDIPKPQILFDKFPSNNETTPFKPLLTSKPHAIVPLEQSLDIVLNDSGVEQYKHPYETEITQSRYPPSTYVKSDPIPYHPFETTEPTFVDTPETVASMLWELKTAKEIAVDLEHHDTRSYIGLVSLMQISTRNKDWLVDTLKPWREQLQMLNEVFADPNILKVFHGSFMDMMWLQRDLGLYVVGLFDTFHASRALGYPKKSLASLLAKFANFKADKKYQTADWRIRPLPQEMSDYARSDTHYLLFVYDNLRNELIDRSNAASPDDNLVDMVLKESKGEALQRYEWPFYDSIRGLGSNGWYKLLSRTPALFSKEQFAVFRAVHHWRDTVAREEDESLHYVMPKHVIYNIATSVPMAMPSLLGVSHPISQPMRLRVGELLDIIKQAKVAGIHGPEMRDFLQPPEVKPEDIVMIESSSTTGQPSTTMVNGAGHMPQRALSKHPLRTDSSRFWGLTFGSSLWQSPTQTVTVHEGLRLAFPLPQLTAEVFKNVKSSTDNSDTLSVDPGARAEHRYQKVRDSKTSSDDGIFVVRQMGGPRKRKMRDTEEQVVSRAERDPQPSAMSGGDKDGIEDQSVIHLEDEEAQSRARKKAERKALKKLKKEQGQVANGTVTSQGRNPDDYEPAEPFDYANAESVLHAKRDLNDRSAPKKAFDPYAKSLDAPKGMRKTKREIAGKSFTFKK